MKMKYEELIEKYPHVKAKVSKQEWKRIFKETLDPEFKIFYLEE